MSDLFEGMHAKMFECLFGLDEESRAKLADYLAEAGVSDSEIARLTAPGIRAGQCFGNCHGGDVGRFVERILLRQGAQGVLLMVTRPPYDEAGHLYVSILEILPAVDHAELPRPDQPPPDDEREAKEG